ncbi:MAG: ribbon-helix-helix protein, CopG family [Deltaproteobacteria bacterium]|nr:ribbon-helix-helix protein, CopG family [Deltaproteobacteria bacterium]
MKKTQGLSLPKEMLNKIEDHLDNYNYLSKSEFVRAAIREKLARLEAEN